MASHIMATLHATSNASLRGSGAGSSDGGHVTTAAAWSSSVVFLSNASSWLRWRPFLREELRMGLRIALTALLLASASTLAAYLGLLMQVRRDMHAGAASVVDGARRLLLDLSLDVEARAWTSLDSIRNVVLPVTTGNASSSLSMLGTASAHVDEFVARYSGMLTLLGVGGTTCPPMVTAVSRIDPPVDVCSPEAALRGAVSNYLEARSSLWDTFLASQRITAILSQLLMHAVFLHQAVTEQSIRIISPNQALPPLSLLAPVEVQLATWHATSLVTTTIAATSLMAATLAERPKLPPSEVASQLVSARMELHWLLATSDVFVRRGTTTSDASTSDFRRAVVDAIAGAATTLSQLDQLPLLSTEGTAARSTTTMEITVDRSRISNVVQHIRAHFDMVAAMAPEQRKALDALVGAFAAAVLATFVALVVFVVLLARFVAYVKGNRQAARLIRDFATCQPITLQSIYGPLIRNALAPTHVTRLHTASSQSRDPTSDASTTTTTVAKAVSSSHSSTAQRGGRGTGDLELLFSAASVFASSLRSFVPPVVRVMRQAPSSKHVEVGSTSQFEASHAATAPSGGASGGDAKRSFALDVRDDVSGDPLDASLARDLAEGCASAHTTQLMVARFGMNLEPRTVSLDDGVLVLFAARRSRSRWLGNASDRDDADAVSTSQEGAGEALRDDLWRTAASQLKSSGGVIVDVSSSVADLAVLWSRSVFQPLGTAGDESGGDHQTAGTEDAIAAAQAITSLVGVSENVASGRNSVHPAARSSVAAFVSSGASCTFTLGKLSARKRACIISGPLLSHASRGLLIARSHPSDILIDADSYRSLSYETQQRCRGAAVYGLTWQEEAAGGEGAAASIGGGGPRVVFSISSLPPFASREDEADATAQRRRYNAIFHACCRYGFERYSGLSSRSPTVAGAETLVEYVGRVPADRNASWLLQQLTAVKHRADCQRAAAMTGAKRSLSKSTQQRTAWTTVL